MAKMNRRTLVAGAAAAGIAASTMGTGITSAAARQDGKTELTIYHIWGTPPGGTPAETAAPMTQVVDAFNEQSDTVFINQVTPGGYNETLQKTQADLAAGNPPDLVSNPWAFLDFAVNGLGANDLATVAGDRLPELQALISDYAWPLVTKDEKLYGLPWGLSTPIIYYNADIFEAAGVDPAVAFDTWENFATEAVKLQDYLDGNPVLALSYNKDWPAQTIIQSNGGRVIDDEGNIGITSPEAIAAMQTIADLDQAGLYDRGTSAELSPSFLAGSTAVITSSVASIRSMRTNATFTLGTSTWPKFGDKPISASTGGSFLAVYTRDEAKYDAIVEFFLFAAGEVGYPLWNQTGYINISKLDLDILEGQEPAYAQFEAGLIRETNWPGSRGLEEQTVWGTYVERIWANDIGVEDGLNEALSEIEALLD